MKGNTMTDTTNSAEPLVTVPLRDLMRVLPFKANDDDMRYYLNGVLVTPYEDHALLVATNGHWMAICESAEARADKDRILAMPDWFVKQIEDACQPPALTDPPDDLDEWPDSRMDRDGLGVLTIEHEGARIVISEGASEELVKPGAAFIDGQFPNWRKVLPDPTTLEPGLFGPFMAKYLSRLHEAVSNQSWHALFCYHSRENPVSPAVFRFGNMPEFVAALMPRLDTHTEPKDWPAWMTKEKAV